MKVLSLILLTLFTAILSEGGRVGTHGYQVLFTDMTETDSNNEISMYLTHLGGFEYPHDYQYIYAGKMTIDRPLKFDPKRIYHGLSIDSSLDDLIAGIIDSFEGTVFDGTFYDGTPMSNKVIFKLEKNNFVNQLIDATPTLPTAKYVVYARVNNHYVMTHLIEGNPNFSHTVHAEIDSDSILADGDILDFPDVENVKEKKIDEGKIYYAVSLSTGASVKVSNVQLFINPKQLNGKFLEKACH